MKPLLHLAHRDTESPCASQPPPRLLSSVQLVLCMKKKEKKICITPSRISENWLILIDILNLPFNPWGNPVSIKRYRITNKTSFLVDPSRNFKCTSVKIEEFLEDEHQRREDLDFLLLFYSVFCQRKILGDDIHNCCWLTCLALLNASLLLEYCTCIIAWSILDSIVYV